MCLKYDIICISPGVRFFFRRQHHVCFITVGITVWPLYFEEGFKSDSGEKYEVSGSRLSAHQAFDASAKTSGYPKPGSRIELLETTETRIICLHWGHNFKSTKKHSRNVGRAGMSVHSFQVQLIVCTVATWSEIQYPELSRTLE